MNKRQKKKNQKKYVPIMADEMNLLSMTTEEYKKAWNDYLKFQQRYGYFKKYRDLKKFKEKQKGKLLFYSFPVGRTMANSLNSIMKISRKKGATIITSQSM